MTAVTLGHLAGARRARGNLGGAEDALREELANLRSLYGQEHRDIATTLTNLGMVLRMRQKLGEAEACQREALAMHRKLAELQPYFHSRKWPEIRIGVGSCGLASGSEPVLAVLTYEARKAGANGVVKTVGFNGMCHREPLVEVVEADGRSTLYGNVTPETARQIARKHIPLRRFRE